MEKEIVLRSTVHHTDLDKLREITELLIPERWRLVSYSHENNGVYVAHYMRYFKYKVG